jgi:hypothetical protein
MFWKYLRPSSSLHKTEAIGSLEKLVPFTEVQSITLQETNINSYCRENFTSRTNRGLFISVIFVCSGGDAGGLFCAILVNYLVSISSSTTQTETAESSKEKSIWISVNR